MRIGDIICTKNLRAYFWNRGVGCHGHAEFCTKKGYSYCVLLLGVAHDTKDFDAVRVLRAMGWKPPRGVDGRRAPPVAPRKRRARAAGDKSK